MMKKELVAILIIILIGTIYLSGCTSTNTNPIIGNWLTETHSIVEFKENGVVLLMNGTLTYEGIYTINNNILSITLEMLGFKSTKLYKYEFENVDTLIIIPLDQSLNMTTWLRIK